MDVNVKITIDLSDRMSGLFFGLVAANAAIEKAAATVEKVTEKYAECEEAAAEPEPEPEACSRASETAEKPRVRRSRTPKPATTPEPEATETPDETEGGELNTPEEPRGPEPRRTGGVTHDDIKKMVADVCGYDDANRDKVLRQLQAVGSKSLSTLPDDQLDAFYAFLQTLKP